MSRAGRNHKLLSQRQVRWSEFLNDFRFPIVYRPGAKSTVPDSLSRRPGDRPSHSKDVTDDRVVHRIQTLLPADRWESALRLHALDTSERKNF